MKYDFIFISTADWDYPFWTNKQHIAKRLADRGYNVLYVDSLGLRRPSVNSRDVKRIFSKLKKFTQGIKQKHEHLWVWSPVVIPLNGNPLIRRFNFKFLKFILKFYSRKLGFKEDTVLWVYNPLSQDLVGKLNEKISVYHCVDELSAQPGMPIQTLVEEEDLLLNKVDIVFTTSQNLYETRKEKNANTYYSPNVADFEHFSKAQDDIEIPEDIAKIKGPVVGFFGAINGYKLSLSLIATVAKNNPDIQFVLIGQVGEGDPWTDISVLEEMENIHLLGPRDYSSLPNYLKAFDVCLLPNNINKYTINMFPMKFFEYLSAGKPVVMTSLPALQDYTDLCYVGDTPEEFSQALRKAINEEDPTLINKRIEEAKKHNWESRIDKMLDTIDRSLSQNKA